jgi:hypothetical protein
MSGGGIFFILAPGIGGGIAVTTGAMATVLVVEPPHRKPMDTAGCSYFAVSQPVQDVPLHVDLILENIDSPDSKLKRRG